MYQVIRDEGGLQGAYCYSLALYNIILTRKTLSSRIYMEE